MIEHDLALCYGVIIPVETEREIEKSLSEDALDDFADLYSRCINSWIGDDYFVGIINSFAEQEDFVYSVSDFVLPSEEDENVIEFRNFFYKNNLERFIKWEPQFLLINFTF